MSTVKANTYLAASGSPTEEPSIPALDQRMAKAWVNFDGSGTVTIRNAYNVSSVTDDNAGRYTVNFGAAMADPNFAALIASNRDYTNGDYSPIAGYGHSGTGRSASHIAISSRDRNTVEDNNWISVAIFGN